MADLKHDASRAAVIADLLKALAHPVRLRIVALLIENEATVSALEQLLGVSQSVVSQQLRILRMADLVQYRRVKGFATYSIKQPRLVDLIHCLEGCRTGDL